jgi:hypothetical protein
MDTILMREFFLWCSVINLGLLILGFVATAFAGDWVYEMHARWFPMPRETFNAAIYVVLGSYKAVVLVFNVVPWIVLSLMA